MSAVPPAAADMHAEGINLKQRQAAVLHRLLRLSSLDPSDPLSVALNSDNNSVDGDASSSSSSSSSPTWKLLIYDRPCQDFLSPLLTVAELRNLGITLHMPLAASRERIPDMPAIYLIRPTEENLKRMAEDVKRGLYDSNYINFSTRVPSAMLEQFAHELFKPSGNVNAKAGAAAGGVVPVGSAAASRIVRIMDQYCDFVCLEDRLFTLNCPSSYPRLNSATSDESTLFGHVDEMVNGLFCALVTLGVVPIIRAKTGHAAEMVAQKLDARLREHLASRNNLFAAGAGSGANALSFHRPLLVLVDRNFDLAAPLLHSWTYQALLADLMGMSSNRVTVPVTDANTEHGADSSFSSSSKSKTRTYDLLSSEDKFWKHHSGKVFPKVAEGVTERLQAYQTEFNAVTKKAGTSASALADGMQTLSISSGSDDLASAINALPKLQKRKKLLDTHMNIATALLKEIKSREIDVFYDVEQSIIQRNVDKQAIASIFGGGGAAAGATAASAASSSTSASATGGAANDQPAKGTFLDRLRFLLVYYLSTNTLTEEQIKQYRNLLMQVNNQAASAGGAAASDPASAVSASPSTPPPELSALDYIQHYKFLHRLSSGSSGFDSPDSSASAKSASAASSSSSGTVGSMLGNFSKLADSLYGGGVGLLAAGVRNLMPTNNHLPLTRAVEQLVMNKESQQESIDTQWKYFDPKSSGNAGRGSIGGGSGGGGVGLSRFASRGQQSGPFKDCMVFVLGGGNYNEYQNLQDWQKENQNNIGIQSVVYGCSELVSPEQFVRQLASLHLQEQQAKNANLPVD